MAFDSLPSKQQPQDAIISPNITSSLYFSPLCSTKSSNFFLSGMISALTPSHTPKTSIRFSRTRTPARRTAPSTRFRSSAALATMSSRERVIVRRARWKLGSRPSAARRHARSAAARESNWTRPKPLDFQFLRAVAISQAKTEPTAASKYSKNSPATAARGMFETCTVAPELPIPVTGDVARTPRPGRTEDSVLGFLRGK